MIVLFNIEQLFLVNCVMLPRWNSIDARLSWGRLGQEEATLAAPLSHAHSGARSWRPRNHREAHLATARTDAGHERESA